MEKKGEEKKEKNGPKKTKIVSNDMQNETRHWSNDISYNELIEIEVYVFRQVKKIEKAKIYMYRGSKCWATPENESNSKRKQLMVYFFYFAVFSMSSSISTSLVQYDLQFVRVLLCLPFIISTIRVFRIIYTMSKVFICKNHPLIYF